MHWGQYQITSSRWQPQNPDGVLLCHKTGRRWTWHTIALAIQMLGFCVLEVSHSLQANRVDVLLLSYATSKISHALPAASRWGKSFWECPKAQSTRKISSKVNGRHARPSYSRCITQQSIIHWKAYQHRDVRFFCLNPQTMTARKITKKTPST